MSPKNISIIVVTMLVLFGVGAFVVSKPKDTEEIVETVLKINIEDVKNHDQKNDCWTVIDNSVYDITAYIPRHPGGDEILRACGTDGTALFTNRTTVEGEPIGSGSPHSKSATSQLANFKVGEVAQ